MGITKYWRTSREEKDDEDEDVISEITGEEPKAKAEQKSVTNYWRTAKKEEEPDLEPSQEAAKKEKDKNILEKAAETVVGAVGAAAKGISDITGIGKKKEEEKPPEFSEISDYTDIEFEETRADKVLRARQELFNTDERVDQIEKELSAFPDKPPKGSEAEKKVNTLKTERDTLNKESKSYRSFIEHPTDDL